MSRAPSCSLTVRPGGLLNCKLLPLRHWTAVFLQERRRVFLDLVGLGLFCLVFFFFSSPCTRTPTLWINANADCNLFDELVCNLTFLSLSFEWIAKERPGKLLGAVQAVAASTHRGIQRAYVAIKAARRVLDVEPVNSVCRGESRVQLLSSILLYSPDHPIYAWIHFIFRSNQIPGGKKKTLLEKQKTETQRVSLSHRRGCYRRCVKVKCKWSGNREWGRHWFPMQVAAGGK